VHARVCACACVCVARLILIIKFAARFIAAHSAAKSSRAIPARSRSLRSCLRELRNVFTFAVSLFLFLSLSLSLSLSLFGEI